MITGNGLKRGNRVAGSRRKPMFAIRLSPARVRRSRLPLACVLHPDQ
jgi:hypothetical protein